MGLLRTVKRQANSAFADVIIQELSDTSKTANAKGIVELFLKPAYACFLRLHCTLEDLERTRAWKYGQEAIREVDALLQAFFALGENKSIQSDVSNWSGGGQKSAVLKAALEKCRHLFPTLSGSFFSKKAVAKSKKGDSGDSVEDTDEGREKRKLVEPSQVTKVSFEVAVPQDLVAGNTFLTTVKVGDETKKVKLTVPNGNPSTLRFTLKIPKPPDDSGRTKKARLEEG